MNIYNLQNEYTHLAIQLQSGEVTPELEEALKINEAEFQNKALAWGYVLSSFNAKYSCSNIQSAIC